MWSANYERANSCCHILINALKFVWMQNYEYIMLNETVRAENLDRLWDFDFCFIARLSNGECRWLNRIERTPFYTLFKRISIHCFVAHSKNTTTFPHSFIHSTAHKRSSLEFRCSKREKKRKNKWNLGKEKTFHIDVIVITELWNIKENNSTRKTERYIYRMLIYSPESWQPTIRQIKFIPCVLYTPSYSHIHSLYFSLSTEHKVSAKARYGTRKNWWNKIKKKIRNYSKPFVGGVCALQNENNFV
jgi:hypothetical protein